jgi:TM2 domain-containing membrane protein YozV
MTSGMLFALAISTLVVVMLVIGSLRSKRNASGADAAPTAVDKAPELVQQFNSSKQTYGAERSPPIISVTNRGPMATFRVVLDGNTIPGFDAEAVRKRLAVMIRGNEETATRLLSGRAMVVKTGIDQATALHYTAALTEIGVSCRSESETLAFDVPPAASTQADKSQDEKYCSDCGAIIKAKAEICPKCGVRQMAPPERTVYGQPTQPFPQRVLAVGPSGSKSRIGAALFAIFLGSFGIHKFYLGQTGQGILYLLFCWTFIPGIIGFIEGIIYLCTSDASFARQYG